WPPMAVTYLSMTWSALGNAGVWADSDVMKLAATTNAIPVNRVSRIMAAVPRSSSLTLLQRHNGIDADGAQHRHEVRKAGSDCQNSNRGQPREWIGRAHAVQDT